MKSVIAIFGTPARDSTIQMTSKLFRNEAIAHQREKFFGELLIVSPTRLGILGLMSIAFVFLLGVFVTFGSLTRTSRSNGSIVPATGLVNIFSIAQGSISAILVSEGQVVRPGDPLIAISLDRSTANLEGVYSSAVTQLDSRRKSLINEMSTQAKLSTLRTIRLAASKADLDEQIELLNAEVRTQADRIDAYRTIERNYKRLATEGFLSDTLYQPKLADLLQQEGQLKSLQRQLISARSARDAIAAEKEQSGLSNQVLNSSLTRGLSELEQQLVEANSKKEVVVKAPVGGTITGIQMRAGEFTPQGARVLSILPVESDLVAIAYVPAKSIAQVKVGNRVVLRYVGYSSLRYGNQMGTVAEISKAAISMADIPPEFKVDSSAYLVTVRLDQQAIGAGTDAEPLKVGTPFEAEIVLAKRPIYETVLDPLGRIWRKSE
jgi:membrane fusion protein